MNRRGASIAIVICAVLAGGLAACGEDDKRFSDAKIVDQLKLKESEGGFRISDDDFCLVDKKLLNNADEVESAADKDELGLVIASRNANVGVLGVPVITPDCASVLKKQLNKLDPPEE